MDAFKARFRSLGYVEGRNFLLDARSADENYTRLPELAAALVDLKVDVLVTYGTPGTLAAKRATNTIPIVMAYSGDALSFGIVSSLARPDGNVTGSTYFLSELLAKRLELLREAVPDIKKVGILVNPNNPLFTLTLRALESAASVLGIDLLKFEARTAGEIETTFSSLRNVGIDGIIVQEDAIFVANTKMIVELASKLKLPLSGYRELAMAGGLIGYGVDFLPMCRRAADFVSTLLKGGKPESIPVEQATRFETIVNLNAARTLGLTMPASMLVRADTVVE